MFRSVVVYFYKKALMKEINHLMEIPKIGTPPAEIIAEMQSAQATDTPWLAGKTWSLQYFIDQEHHELLKAAYNQYFSNNYINPFLFKSLLKMEKESPTSI